MRRYRANCNLRNLLSASIVLLSSSATGVSAQMDMPTGSEFTNSIGMRLVRIEPGSFMMGAADGERYEDNFDERPRREVSISRPFYMGVFEVTNEQYRHFDPEPDRAGLPDKPGLWSDPDEAVTYVSWHEAAAFCEWLSEREGLPYRLPTEAEWEYACRAGTDTAFSTGDELPETYHKNQKSEWALQPIRVHVGKTPANALGLYDMHGNVEEWCQDWYGPYPADPQTDPVGHKSGEYKVTRGGSHSTEIEYLRSANRMGTLPADRHWLIGFRVVLGAMPDTKPLPDPEPPLWARDVNQESRDWSDTANPDEPYFLGPRRYVNIPKGSEQPMFGHNHCPAIVGCPNGDMLAIWYSCIKEPGRELAILASRLRRGADQWEPASVFWNTPDRNDHASAMWWDGDKTLYHFNGMSSDATWGKLALIVRTSTDNGATWSKARIINATHGWANMPVESVIGTREGFIILPCDAVPGGKGGTAIHISGDGGKTWNDPGYGTGQTEFVDGGKGGRIAGIHGGLCQLNDGRLMAFGRSDDINGRMPKSISDDMGANWSYSASEFPPITSGQRLVLLRLREGPLFFASFARQLTVTDETGTQRTVTGLYAAVSHDEGETWPVRRLIADDKPEHPVEGTDGHLFMMSGRKAESMGYMSVCQTPDGLINLISSRQHYVFNLKWLTTPAPPIPPPPPPPEAIGLPVKAEIPRTYSADTHPTKGEGHWRFSGSGMTEEDAITDFSDGHASIKTGSAQRARWADDAPEGFGMVAAAKGFTVEIELQVLRSTAATRGIDFEAYVGDGTPTGNHYFITITTSGVYWHGQEGFEPVLEDADNHSAPHTYRFAVREDGPVQIYRDGELLAVREATHSVDGMLGTWGPYLQWGEGAGGSEADAAVGYVAYDLSGAYQPGE